MAEERASAERLHIGFFGLRNVGKSSIVNAVTGQDLSVVSDVAGTTTDPVQKAMELLPLGPVVILDTPGIDDEGALGELRVKKTLHAMNRTDIAVLVTDVERRLQTEPEQKLIAEFHRKSIPFLVVCNRSDTRAVTEDELKELYARCNPGTPSAVAGSTPKSDTKVKLIVTSAVERVGIEELKNSLGEFAKDLENNKKIVLDLLEPQDIVVLVTPIDAAAPKGRLILPQVQTLRELLDGHCIPVVVQVEELAGTLAALAKKPKLVITDSQAFGPVSKLVPEDIPLTSFSILFARYKGYLTEAVRGAAMLSGLSDGDRVLISEGCTHHRQCGDIGTVKLPGLIRKVTGKNPEFHYTSGQEFADDLSEYKLVIHCGACMLNEREMTSRLRTATEQNCPMTNYGIALARLNGILMRSLSLFPQLQQLLGDK